MNKTMKKSYITPATLVVKLAPKTTLLTTSNPVVTVNWDETVEAGDVEVKTYNGGAGSVNWDDDWSAQ